MDIFTIISLTGGLAMFLYGMEVMGDGLKQGSGETLKKVLGKLTQNVIFGVLTGTLVTAVIQSSTATIVLTVGLLSVGILNLEQSASIVLGANIGTTVTAQIIRLMDVDSNGHILIEFFKPSTLAPLALTVGAVLMLFIKKRGSRTTGEIFVGFGVLFSGLLTMTSAVTPLAESETFINILTKVGSSPLLGILAGFVLTVILQSSSAMVGILQALSSTGVMSFSLIYPVIMGINLGTCVTTALVCSIGSSRDAKRVGIVHIAFNSIGTVVFMIAMTVMRRAGAFPNMWGSIVDSGAIADFQTLFNLITAILLLPFTRQLVKLSLAVIRPEEKPSELNTEVKRLDPKLFVSPAVALSEAQRAVAAMGRAAYENFRLSCLQLEDFDQGRSDEIDAGETRIDSFADDADNFFIGLSGHIGSGEPEHELNMLMQTVPNYERIGDYATNFNEYAQKLHSEKLAFSRPAVEELHLLERAVDEIIQLTNRAFEENDNGAARKIEPLEEVIDDIVGILRDRHTERLRKGVCSIGSGVIFLELLTYFERASDQCSSIAMLMLARDDREISRNHHAYLEKLHQSGESDYALEFARRREEFITPLENIRY